MPDSWFQAGPPQVARDGMSLRMSGWLAGTGNLPATWTVSLVRENRVWRMKWLIGDDDSSVSLRDWFADGDDRKGAEFSPGRTFTVADATFTGKSHCTLRRPFTLEIVPETALQVDVAAPGWSATCGQLTIRAPVDDAFSTEAEAVLDLNGVSPRPKPGFVAELSRMVSPTRGWNLGPLGGQFSPLTARLRPREEGLTIESDRRRTGTPVHVYLRRSHATASLRLLPSSTVRTIPLDGVRLGVLTRRNRTETLASGRLWADVTERPSVVRAGSFSALVRRPENSSGLDGVKVYAAPHLALPAELLVLHPPGSDGARYDVDFRRGHGLDSFSPAARVKAGHRGMPISVTLGNRPTPAPVTTEGRLHVGRESGADVPLHHPDAEDLDHDAPVVRARRHADGLDVGFTFHRHRLVIEGSKSEIRSAGGRRGVRLAPQHVFEEVFTDSAPSLASRALSILQPRRPSCAQEKPARHLGKPATFAGRGGPESVLARTRASGSSRIVFEASAAGTVTPLSVAGLTDWSGLRLRVPRRAAPEQSVEQELAGIGIMADTSREQAKAKVTDSLVAPTASETSLEVVTGLSFSPDASAHLRTPRGAPDPAAAPLWTAQLDLTPRRLVDQPPQPPAVVRAVWAEDLSASDLLGGGECRPVADDPFPSSLNRRDRHEIALQSSAFGIAAMRSLSLTGHDLTSSRVRVPRLDEKPFELIDKDYRPLVPGTQVEVLGEGVMSPAPFRRFNARLTPYGADLDAEWRAEPTAPIPANGFFSPAFSLESYRHRTSLGSDVFVEVLYKGFLFPYGFRVSLLKVTEREPYAEPRLGPLMPAVRRWFIIPSQQWKRFPGVHQPFEGREFPVRRARLAPGRTPEIADPVNDGDLIKPGPPAKADTGCDVPCRSPDARVFWPRVKTTGGDAPLLLFDVETDETSGLRSLPMIFVDNAAAHDPAQVQHLVRRYNQMSEGGREDAGASEKTRERHKGAMTRFADEIEGGEASFETDTVRLGARGRLDASGAEFFAMDPFMEGADEPPFYPVMMDAVIRVPALDRLVGAPQGHRTVGYNGNYLRHGFDPKGNPSELYLNFLGDPAVMPLSGRGEVSGGFAQTPTRISGVSRKNAVVGAAPKIPTGRAGLLSGPETAPIGVDHLTPWDLSEVETGRFNPRSFFAFGKLLGLIDLGAVVEAAAMGVADPKLVETVRHGVSETLTAEARKAAGFAAEGLEKAEGAARVRLRELLPTARLEDFYPGFISSLGELRAGLADYASGAAPDPTPIVRAWGDVRGEIESVAADPTPAILVKAMADLRARVSEAEQALEALKSAFTASVVKSVNDRIDAVAMRLGDELAGVVLGPFAPIEGMQDVERMRLILRGEMPPPADVASALLWHSLGAPIVEASGAIRALATAADEVEDLKRLPERATACVRTIIASARRTAEFAAAARLRSTVCGPIRAIANLAVTRFREPAVTGLTERLTALVAATKRLSGASLPETVAGRSVAIALAQVRASGDALGQAGLRLAADVDALEAAIDGMPTAACALPVDVAREIGRVLSAGDAVLSSVEALSTCVVDALERAQALPDVIRKEVVGDLDICLRSAGDLSARVTAALSSEAVEDAIQLVPPEFRPRCEAALSDFRAEVIKIEAAIATMPTAMTPDAARAFLASVARAFDAERRLLSAALDFAIPTTQVVDAVSDLAGAMISDVLAPVTDLHLRLSAEAGRLLTQLVGAPDLVLALTGPLVDKLNRAKAAVDRDAADLAGIARLGVGGLPQAQALLSRWDRDRPGMVSAFETLSEMLATLAKGQIGAIFDLAAAERLLRDALKRFIPSRVTLAYEWKTALRPFPSGAPIFLPAGGLSLKTTIEADLLASAPPKRSVRGDLGPFTIKILGSLPLVDIAFLGASFEIVDGGKPRMTAQIGTVQLGKTLSFLQGIGPALGLPAEIRVDPWFAPPGVKAGYYFATPVVQFGGVTFINVDLEASILLPFGDSPARICLRVGSRDNPLLISIAPCYAGGGMISLVSSAGGIVAYEIQLEFGAAVAIRFGPLRGQGRVTTGLYMMARENGGRLFEGFVHARGEGQIACFGVSVNMEVRVTDDGSGKMRGSASYRFRFRVGLVSVGYTVTARYEFKGGRKNSRLAASDATMAELETNAAGSPAWSRAWPAPPDKARNWNAYRRNFLQDWAG